MTRIFDPLPFISGSLEAGRGLELEFLIRSGVPEAQSGGVKLEVSRTHAGAIEGVSHDGDSQALGVGGVDPKLMGSSGDRSEKHPGEA